MAHPPISCKAGRCILHIFLGISWQYLAYQHVKKPVISASRGNWENLKYRFHISERSVFWPSSAYQKDSRSIIWWWKCHTFLKHGQVAELMGSFLLIPSREKNFGIGQCSVVLESCGATKSFRLCGEIRTYSCSPSVIWLKRWLRPEVWTDNSEQFQWQRFDWLGERMSGFQHLAPAITLAISSLLNR